MRKMIVTIALMIGFAAAGSLLPSRAEAITLSTPAALQHALDGKGVVEKARYVCRRVWTGWGWRRSCWWRPNYRYGYGYRHYPRYRYGYYRPYPSYRYW